MPSTDGHVRLKTLVQQLSRPLSYASRGASTRRATIKTIGPFVTRHVLGVLADQMYAPSVEMDLLALRELFTDFNEGLPVSEQERRLSLARLVLARLGKTAEDGGWVDQEASRPSATRRAPSIDVSSVPIRFVPGIGPKRAVLLERLGIRTIEDALWYVPWRYEDRSEITAIGRLSPGAQATVCGVVESATTKRTARRGLSILTVRIADESGAVPLIYFNQPYLEEVFRPGVRMMISGTVSAGTGGWADLKFESPEYEVWEGGKDGLLHVGRIVAIYHETKGLTSRHLRAIMRAVLTEHLHDVVDILPPSLRARRRVPSIQSALHEVHVPAKKTDLAALNRGVSPAHRRLAFEECFLLELALGLRHQSVKEETKGIRFDPATPLLARLHARLPFTLTAAQQRVIADVQRDMGSSRPMNRLVQGDVGCGKTVVALHALLIACGSGYQAALMAPTEILAEQHYLTLKRLVESLGLCIVLLKSAGTTRTKSSIRDQIETGRADIVVGTHALIQKGVRFHRLGLAVIDEQHKFGVLQRKTLVDKGYRPDVLVMTATPIPRTLALTVYGDLDLSVIDALPPGRKPVTTWRFGAGERRRAYRLVEQELRAGRQAYIVYPLVEESAKVDLQAVKEAAARLQEREFRGFRVAMLHGRMKSDEKEHTMAAFKAGQIQILVATTVIEVGVDVPGASVMVIEHADRFGLAQLHQLRGRVGRGTAQSYCLLITSSAIGDDASRSLSMQRLQALVRSNDGFLIAEEDLRIRGPGEFFGVRQWGAPEFKAANLLRDRALLEQAREDAFELLQRDRGLQSPLHEPLRRAMLRRWQEKLDLASVS